MLVKVSDMNKKALRILTAEEHCSAQELAEKLGTHTSGVYTIIREFRKKGIGVHTTNRGYVLSEYANKVDDVNFLRRLNGRRASDYIALSASERHIRSRWTSMSDRQNLKLITAPIHVEIKSLIEGQRILLEAQKSMEPIKITLKTKK
jgi:biotin operon repressor